MTIPNIWKTKIHVPNNQNVQSVGNRAFEHHSTTVKNWRRSERHGDFTHMMIE